ncbi:hypothetical protein CHLRE_06g262977v5 [Chlamydomonas reinhardtii]|uniref:Uncharacterized protein n=1 Tax=Chlamydomonas reinhardtii TaxID=3055 RepID=A0A2K3DMS9_CHLRE|nr:uncharacterized protein CHLRE_06g262977v5 [Chlamydomonas reinhardtii]PNW81847.1 hypothetical protein CHLRE_06g262977v5 [Chlamydomonas reinhardtii]
MLLTPSAGSPAAALHAPSSSRNSRLSSGHSRPSSCCSSHGLACSSSTHTVLPSKRLSSAAGTFRGSRSVPLRNRIIAAAAAPRSPPGSSTSGSPGVDPPQKTAADAAGGHTPQQPAAVIGIDFGTSGSGYAAILGPFASGAAQRPIKSCAQWPDDPHSGGELKTKTAILYRGDKVDAWGWTAWRRWSEMSAAERLTADWCYLEGFKLLLGDNDSGGGGGGSARGGPDLKALGPRLPKGKNAVDVVSDFLSELRRFTFKRLKDQYAKSPAAAATAAANGGGGAAAAAALDAASVVWCVTAPAMWGEAAKERLRRAADRAGMSFASKSDSLILALEPEAAAVAMTKMNRIRAAASAARTAANAAAGGDSNDAGAGGGLRPVTGGSGPKQQQKGGGGAAAVKEGEEQELEDGDVVLVVDCGGGTADVTLHEVVIDEAQGDIPMTIHLYEAAVGKGAEAGGRSVDAALFALLRGHVGPEVWDEWKKLHPGEWTELSSKWEDKKTKMKEGDPALELQLPPALMARCQQRMAVQSPAAQPGLHLDATLGLVQFSRELLRAEVFGPVMDQIAAVVKEVEAEGRQRRGKKATKMLLAGGFGNSPLLQERMRELQRQLGVPLLMPPVPGTVVVTGAALLGAEPGLVRARRCRLTYGIRCRALWTSEEAVSYSAFGYPQRIWKPEDNEYFADGVFETFARRGQLVATDEAVKRVFCPTSSTTTAIAIDVYASPAAEARYTCEPGMRRVAQLTLELPAGWRQRVANRTDYDVEVELRFGAAAITAVARDPHTGDAVATRFNWL